MINGGARDVVLGRIRATKNNSATSGEAAEAGWREIPRGYQRRARRQRHEVIELLVDRLRDYDAQVARVRVEDLQGAVAAMLTARGARRMVVPAGIRKDAMASDSDFVVDEGLTAAELNDVDGVLTESTLAIAETGTIVLQAGPGQGRRLISLVPDYHVCVVREVDVVETVPEALERLSMTAGLATTFISGPSATADIEMTRIKGVHGPRFLDVIVVM